jgi:hypothetical protein
MHRRQKAFSVEPDPGSQRRPFESRARIAALAVLLGLGTLYAAQPQDAAQPKANPQKQAAPQPSQPSPQQAAQQQNKQQMRGLDEQIQEVKSDVLSIAADLGRLEEKLIYPSGTQVAIFVALAKGDTMRLDAVRLQVDGQLVAHYIYSFKELEALRKGGVQRLYVGNVATGDHQIEVVVDGKRDNGADVTRTDHFSIRKDVKPKLVQLTVSGTSPVTLGEF